MFELIILVLTVQWLFSFFGQSIHPAIPHSGGFMYALSFCIVALIFMNFLVQV